MSRYEVVQLVIGALQVVVMLLGFIMAIQQLKKYIQEVTKAHDWNRRKASQEACDSFLNAHIHNTWNTLHDALVNEKKMFKDLSDDERTAMRGLMNYFETLGICLKNSIVDEDIIWDCFGSLWPLLYSHAQEVIKEERHNRGDIQVFEHFEDYGMAFQKRNDEARKMQETASKRPGKPLIRG